MIMKKLCYLLVIFCAFALLYSCGKTYNADPNLLPGKWKSGTLFDKYLSNGTGLTWDESDGVLEDEAQKFEWTLTKDDLTIIHIGEMGQKVPKEYKITELTETIHKYKNDSGKNYTFQKVN
jgi:hypothetical protein